MQKKSLTPQKIIETEIERRGESNDWKTAYVMIHELIQKPQWRLFRAGDTIFLMHNHNNDQQSVEFFIYNADTEDDLRENIKDFFRALKISRFNYAIFEPIGQNTEQLIRSVNRNVTKEGNILQIEL